jgi:hypothetical protein
MADTYKILLAEWAAVLLELVDYLMDFLHKLSFMHIFYNVLSVIVVTSASQLGSAEAFYETHSQEGTILISSGSGALVLSGFGCHFSDTSQTLLGVVPSWMCSGLFVSSDTLKRMTSFQQGFSAVSLDGQFDPVLGSDDRTVSLAHSSWFFSTFFVEGSVVSAYTKNSFFAVAKFDLWKQEKATEDKACTCCGHARRKGHRR